MKTLIGKFKAPHGVKGEIKTEIFLENVDLIKNTKIFTEISSFEIDEIRSFRDNVYIFKIKGFQSPEEVRELTNKEIFCEIEVLKASQEDLILSELIGFSVIFEEEVVGTVVDIVNYGSGDAIEVEMNIKNGKKPQNNIFLIEEINCDKTHKKIFVKYIV